MARPNKKAVLQEHIVWLPCVYNSSLFVIAHAIEKKTVFTTICTLSLHVHVYLDTTVVRSYLAISNNAYQCAVDNCAL